MVVELSHGIEAVGEARGEEPVDLALSRRREFEKYPGGSSMKPQRADIVPSRECRFLR